MQVVFGPVPSRRLGRSLGIDPIPPKTCNWNCVYCQLGRTRPLTARRAEYIPAEEILAQARAALARLDPTALDWVTFVGSGETTLHARLGWLIRQVKSLTPKPVAVITNGSLLYRPEVRAELLAADAVLPTVDAGTPELYRRINRPWPVPDFETYIQGLVAFRRVYQGRLWVEVMLVRGLNDSEEALRAIAAVLDRIQPDRVHLNLPTRPPAEPWVQPPDHEGLLRATAILGARARVVPPAVGDFDLSLYPNVMDAMVAILARHPMRERDLLAALRRWSPADARQALDALARSGRAQVVERYGERFWTLASAYYAPNSRSRGDSAAS